MNTQHSLKFFWTLAVLTSTFAFGQKVDEKQEPLSRFSAKDVWEQETFSRADHKVLVIQDRKYTKAKKYELGLHGGYANSGAFYNSYPYGVHGAYHFSEYVGLEAFANYSANKLTEDGKQINKFLTDYNFGASKEFQQPKLYTGLGLMWSPIYGKFAFFRSRIIHFDFYGTAGLAVLKTESNLTAAQGGRNQTHYATLASVGMRTFLSQLFSLRVDVRNSIYRSDFAPTRLGAQGSTVTRSQFQYTLGLSLLLGSGR